MKFLLSKMPGEQGKSGERKEENPGKEEMPFAIGGHPALRLSDGA